MSKVRKVYGIYGLLEWHGTVESNGVRMKVDFTNGTVTAFGTAPATFATENPVTQHFIENSDQFKKGRIRIYQVLPLPGQGENNVDGEESAPIELEKVEIPSLEDAKEYLIENFNVSRNKLRSTAAIKKEAAANGIEFIGI